MAPCPPRYRRYCRPHEGFNAGAGPRRHEWSTSNDMSMRRQALAAPCSGTGQMAIRVPGFTTLREAVGSRVAPDRFPGSPGGLRVSRRHLISWSGTILPPETLYAHTDTCDDSPLSSNLSC